MIVLLLLARATRANVRTLRMLAHEQQQTTTTNTFQSSRVLLEEVDRNRCPRLCQEEGQDPLVFGACVLYCEPCYFQQDLGYGDEFCIDEYMELTGTLPPWLDIMDDNNNNNNTETPQPLCPLGFLAGEFWYTSDPFRNLQKVRIVGLYNNTSNESQRVLPEFFQIWTKNLEQNDRPYVPPTSLEGSFGDNEVVVESGATVELAVTIDLSLAPEDDNAIFMRVYTKPGGFDPLLLALVSAQITCFNEVMPSQPAPPVCPTQFLPQQGVFTSDPSYENIRAVQVTADFKNIRDGPLTVMSNEFQVWTQGPNKENYDIPPSVLDPDADGRVIHPGETTTVVFTIDLRDSPKYHSIISIRLYTRQLGTNQEGIDLVDTTIICIT
ncbi:expressed unknown protein [Seminavis robusta]|uniref:Uncharacterized protein n=1 Tax=Seminavis robusta TaxID=568900 RepID=A0A9N8HRH7_9STRA|nr:expressed unknown protein [Seminavis robusta]|eukprot:Sro1075_g238440.1 n/a (381) ;mRNA; f:26667-27809